MSLSAIINRPCSIIRTTPSVSTDELGNATNTTASIVTVCEVQQRSRDEVPESEWSQAQWMGFFLPGTAFDTGDQVEVDGLGTFEVVGAPWPARNPRTQAESHVEATLNMTAGGVQGS